MKNMKPLKILMILLLLCLSLNIVQAQSVKLQEGTSLRIALKQELNSKTAEVGSIVELEVIDNVEVDGSIVIASGTPVKGEITEASKAKMMGKAGKIDFIITYTRSVDGQNIRLRSTQTFAGKEGTGGVVAAAVLVAAPLIFIKGKDITINKGRNFNAFVDKDYIFNKQDLVTHTNDDQSNNGIQTNGKIQTNVDNSIPVLNPNQKRIALIIGNRDYPSNPLFNPVHDALAMSKELTSLGFEVTTLTNGTQKQMERFITEYGEKLSDDRNIVGLFYYSGHGMQVNGKNFLVPTDAVTENEQDIAVYCVDMNVLLTNLENAGNKMNVIILDACRSNPFSRGSRSPGGTGLATMNAPAGTIIAFATSPGSTASDGTGKNGLYTQELLKALEVPNTKIEDVFKKVRTQVKILSDGTQIPWENSALEGDFYFKKSQSVK